MIQQKTNGKVLRLKSRCSRTGTARVACYLTWRIGRYRYQGRARFTHYFAGDALAWGYTFRGTKKKIGCRRCRAKRLRW